MDNYLVSARKYRPQTFDSVVGQQHITSTLKNAIRTGQLAQAFLFCGPRGVGKTTCARILAKTINCTALTPDAEPCNECENCRSFNEGASMNIFELDAASNNSVNDMRELVEQVAFPPQTGRYKVYIIDEVHMLSQAAFNAFLKTLEEPPAYAKFILATTERHKVLPTIVSRCQVFDFRRISSADIAAHLAHVAQCEGVACEPEALHLIARKAEGGLRDALSLFDQMATLSAGNITLSQCLQCLNMLDYDCFFKLVDCIAAANLAGALVLCKEVFDSGRDGQQLLTGLTSHLRNLMVSLDPATHQLLDAGPEMGRRYAEQAARCGLPMLLKVLEVASDCEYRYRDANNKRLFVEVSIVKIASAATSPD
ncbi:MAG: DNA polymerase III subunit gamma/tau [Bacteroidales bacterium]|nr:DNA polymerase III subunit gamma/tau [Bacteroidales bacterium]